MEKNYQHINEQKLLRSTNLSVRKNYQFIDEKIQKSTDQPIHRSINESINQYDCEVASLVD